MVERVTSRPKAILPFRKKVFYPVWAEAIPLGQRKLIRSWFVACTSRGTSGWERTLAKYRVLIDGPFRTKAIALKYARAHRHGLQCHEHEDCVMHPEIGIACSARAWTDKFGKKQS